MCHWTKNGSGSRESWKFSGTDPYDGYFCVPALSGHRKPGTDQFHPEKDPLTGLYNQEAFREAVIEILAHSKPDEVYAIEYMDINNFGYINENYGYKVGDSVLKMFAQDIFVQEYFRAGCRLYSDFFLLLIADESQEK